MASLLNQGLLDEDDYLDAKAVRRLMREHVLGKGIHGALLWAAVMFQAWRARWA